MSNQGQSNPKPTSEQGDDFDIAAAAQFLKLLDPEATRFTFQTFDDNVDRRKKNTAPLKDKHGELLRDKSGAVVKGKDPFAENHSGTLDQRLDWLKTANEQGAGVYVSINRTNLKGRKIDNVESIRAFFNDLDGAPLDPVLNDPDVPEPHFTVQSSPGKWQVYWLVTAAALKDFKPAQLALAKKFNGDPSVHDLPRVMRLPGFWHRKGKPFRVEIGNINDAPRYDAKEFMAKLGVDDTPDDTDNPFTQQAKQNDSQWQKLNSEALENLDKWILKLFPDAARSTNGYRISSATLGRALQEDLSITPQGIKDFGVHDIGDAREGKRTPIDLVMEHGGKTFEDTVAWLHQQLGHDAKVDPHITKLNERFALVIVGDTTAVLKTSTKEIGFLKVSAFEQWHANRHVQHNDKKVPLGKYWITHPQRRQYEGITFSPGHDVPGHYNLWRGFSVEPKQGQCSKFLKHIEENVCCGDKEHYRWVVGWFADIVQHPDRKIGTSLVLRGEQGTGKTKVGEVIGSLFRPHYVPVSDPRFITGRFNSHLVSCLLLHADEGFWAGDHSAEGKLKDLITGEHQLIEFKGKEPVRVRNYVRLLVTGNSEWLVPAGFGERRFATFDVGKKHQKDYPYFAAIDAEMDNGGREALLYHLLHVDLSNINLRTIPKTSALFEQQVSSLTPEQSWWLDTLMHGELPRGCDEKGQCPSANLFDRYIARVTRQGVRRRSIEVQIGSFLKKYVPGLRKPRATYRRWDGFQNVDFFGWTYVFPPLKECREVLVNQPLVRVIYNCHFKLKGEGDLNYER